MPAVAAAFLTDKIRAKMITNHKSSSVRASVVSSSLTDHGKAEEHVREQNEDSCEHPLVLYDGKGDDDEERTRYSAVDHRFFTEVR